MPTLTPPHIDRRPDRDSHTPNDGDNGNGRRPPTDKRTGGNGEGDNWDGHPISKRGPRERLSRARIAIMLTLSVVGMLFVALAVVFFVTKASATSGTLSAGGKLDPSQVWHATAVPRILWLNTALLLLSSLTAEFARRSMFREHELMEEWLGIGRPISGRATAWMSVTLVLGLGFVAGQIKAWSLIAQRLPYLRANPSSKFFYLLTGSHAAHLVVGIGALIGALIALQRSRSLGTRQVVVDTTTWYWHAMGVLWIFLFLLLEYGQ